MKTIRIKLIDDSDWKNPYTISKDYEIKNNLEDETIRTTIKKLIKEKRENDEYDYYDTAIFEEIEKKLNLKEINANIKEFKFDF